MAIDSLVTAVAAHPRHEVVAAGYEDGTAILAQVGRRQQYLIRPAGGGAVTALAWCPEGRHLAVGTEDGFAGRLELADWRAPPPDPE